MNRMKRCWALALSFLKIGLFTFGGGYAMIALIEGEFVDRRKWIDREEFLNVVAIAESTPGPIAINAATYIGYKICGILGAAFATVAVCLPSFVIIYTISLFLDAFLSLSYVDHAFRGIRVGVAYLIISAGVRMLKKMKKTPLQVVLLSLTVLLVEITTLFAVKVSSIVFIFSGALLGVLTYGLKRFASQKSEEVTE